MIMSIAACLRSSSKDLQAFGRLKAMFRLILAVRASPISLLVCPFFSCIAFCMDRFRGEARESVSWWNIEELKNLRFPF